MRFSTGIARGAWLAVVLLRSPVRSLLTRKWIRRRAPSMPRAPPVPNIRGRPNSQPRRKALTQANEAVTARDYRLALNYALESREQAQNAARTAADTRAKLRGDVERSIAEAKSQMAQARARMEGPSGAQIPRSTRRTAQQRLKQLEGELQKADAGLQAEKYMEAERLLMGVKKQIQSVVTTISRGPSSQSQRRLNGKELYVRNLNYGRFSSPQLLRERSPPSRSDTRRRHAIRRAACHLGRRRPCARGAAVGCRGNC